MMIRALVSFLCLLSWASYAEAASCSGSFVTGYSAPPLTVDVFGAADTTVTSTIPVNVVMNNNGTCTYTITFFSDRTQTAAKRAVSSGANSAYYYIQDSAQNTLISSTSASSASARLNFTATSKTQTLASPQYTFRFASSDIAPMGSYTGTITATLYVSSGNKQTQISQIQYPVTIVVPNGTMISLGNLQTTGDSFAVLDLGELYSGLQNTTTMSLRSNNAYNITLSSQNRGVLKLAGSTGANAEIPYTAKFNNSAVTLTSGVATVLSNSAATSASGRSYPLVITVPDVTNKYSGQYIDQLTITVEAR